MHKLEDFLKQNAPQAPARPINEFVQILNRIEDEKSFWENLRETIFSKPFWTASFGSAALAAVVMALTINLETPTPEEQTFTQTASLYADDLDADPEGYDYDMFAREDKY